MAEEVGRGVGGTIGLERLRDTARSGKQGTFPLMGNETVRNATCFTSILDPRLALKISS